MFFKPPFGLWESINDYKSFKLISYLGNWFLYYLIHVGMKLGLCSFITKCTQIENFRLNHFARGKTCIFLHVYKIIILAHLLAHYKQTWYYYSLLELCLLARVLMPIVLTYLDFSPYSIINSYSYMYQFIVT